ncbi:hypothetical protein K1719_030696 [Acacia pycnantha]|nr:hypothetical protein K1719_030696 [Acacia pycnantha]
MKISIRNWETPERERPVMKLNFRQYSLKTSPTADSARISSKLHQQLTVPESPHSKSRKLADHVMNENEIMLKIEKSQGGGKKSSPTQIVLRSEEFLEAQVENGIHTHQTSESSLRDLLSHIACFLFGFVARALETMASPLVLGTSVAAAALGGRYLISKWQAFKAGPKIPWARRFYPGGFENVMTKREAALILGVRESTVMDKIKEAHRRVMMANHPDAGGSHYLASKINEAKDIFMGKSRGGTSAF